MLRVAARPVVFAACLAMLAGCSKKNGESQSQADSLQVETAQAKTGGTVIRRLESECKTLNWVLYTTAYENFVLRLLYDPLVDYNEKNEMIPVLAASLPEVSADHLRVTVRLRDDIHWQDGVPITAEDVKFSMDKIQ